MTYAIDACHFLDLIGKDPEDVCKRALCHFDRNEKCYKIPIWGEEYGVYPEQSRVIRLGDDKSDINIYLGLFIVHYLLTSKAIPVSKEWISEKDIPGGVAFFRGPHAIPTNVIEKRYGDDIGGFCNRCEQLDGVPLDMADRAYYFEIAPRTPAAVLLWKGDDEFPAESKILFDSTIAEHLALDIIFALAVTICSRVAGYPMDENKRRKINHGAMD